MLLKELFDQSLDFSIIDKEKYEFELDGLKYRVTFDLNNLPKAAQEKYDKDGDDKAYEVIFYSIKKGTHSVDLGITNSGNAIIVFSTVIKIIADFVKKQKPKFFYFSAEESSRKKLYKRISTSIVNKTNYELFYRFDNNYGENYVFKIKE